MRETRHGPVLDRVPIGATGSTYADVEGTYALRWVGRDVGLRPSTAVRLAGATDFASFAAAAADVACPGQNFVYADVDGHVGLRVTGRYPVRREGDGTVPLPDHGWDGWVPDDELPAVLDPPEGRVVSANDGAHAPRAPHLLTRDFHAPDRSRRIDELLDARERHDAASFAAMQRDTVSLAARATTPLLLERVPEAAAFLGDWDHDLAAGSTAAAVWTAWTGTIARRALADRLGPELLAAYTASWETWRCSVLPALLRRPEGWLDDDMLRRALTEALEELGTPIPTWGDVHRLVLAHPLAAIPGLEPLFVAVDAPIGGDAQTVAASGIDGAAGMRAAVIASARMVWDLANLDDPTASTVLVPSGVSGNPASPHWRDQTAAYLSGEVPGGPARRPRAHPGAAGEPVASRHAEVQRPPHPQVHALPARPAEAEAFQAEPPLVRPVDARHHGGRGGPDRLELHAGPRGEQHGAPDRPGAHRGRVLRRHVLEVSNGSVCTTCG